MDNKTFSYRYSPKRNKEIEDIRNKYLPKEERPIDVLRRLDLRVQRAGLIPGLSLGAVGCMMLGIGTCIGLGALAGDATVAVVLDIIGTLVMISAYPVYRYVSGKTRVRLIPEILDLSEKIMGK